MPDYVLIFIWGFSSPAGSQSTRCRFLTASVRSSYDSCFAEATWVHTLLSYSLPLAFDKLLLPAVMGH